MLTDIINNLVEEIKRLNPNLTGGTFVKTLRNFPIDSDGIYAGIMDNHQSYFYVRLIQEIVYTKSSKPYLINCDDPTKPCELDVNIPLRLIVVAWEQDPFRVERRLRESLCEMVWNTKETTFIPTKSYLHSDVVAEIELGKKFRWREELTLVALDGNLKTSWRYNSCDVISLCDINVC